MTDEDAPVRSEIDDLRQGPLADEADLMRQQVQARIDEAAAARKSPEEPQQVTSEFIRACLFANAVGDGTLYATILRDQFVYCKSIKEWYEWNGVYWQLDTMERSLVAVEKIVPHYLAEYKRVAAELSYLIAGGADPKSAAALKMASLRDKLLSRAAQLRDDKRRTSCLKFAHTIENPLAVKGEEFDLHPWLLPCKNGVIDLKTGVLKPGRPGDYLSLASPIEFHGIDTPAPLWEKSLLEIFGDDAEMVAYLQRLFGYCVTGVVKEKVFPVLYGKTGWNGRSLIVETINHVMGSLAAPIQSEMLLTQKFAKSSAGPSPDIVALKGVRLAFASEVDEGQRFSASKVKWLTGNDSLTGRGLQEKRATTFTPTHKLMLMTNTQPGAPGKDKAFWERMHLIEFNISFVNRDPLLPHERRANLNLSREIMKEAPGILAWLVRGSLLYQQYGLQPPLAVKEASAKYRKNEADLVGDFIDECCVVDTASKVQASLIFQRFVDWYHDNHGKGDKLTGTWFGKQFTYYFEKTKYNGCVYYQGVSLKDYVKPTDGESDSFL